MLNEPLFAHLWEVVDHYIYNILKPNTRASLRSMHTKGYTIQKPGSVQETLISLFLKHGISDAAKTEICAAFEGYSSRPTEQIVEEEEDLVVGVGGIGIQSVVEVEVIGEAVTIVAIRRGGEFDLLKRKKVAMQKTALGQITLLKKVAQDGSIPDDDEEWTMIQNWLGSLWQ